MAKSLANAIEVLADLGESGAPLAGATWIMRAPIRGEQDDRNYVAIGHIQDLQSTRITDQEIRLGACLTHSRLEAELADIGQCNGLRMAASGAANPAVRQMATLGGNIMTWNFPASDLPPALLCLDAVVELRTSNGAEHLPFGRFLELRRVMPQNTLVTGVIIHRTSMKTGHARLPLRKAGDYPVAIVSVACDVGLDGSIKNIRIAVGSVEATARRWTQLEEQLRGTPLEPGLAHDAAVACVDTFVGREGVDAPGWYRVRVLPALVRRAMQTIALAA